ncbi:MAG: hypothetical protein AAF438_08380 [Pseudomonadota bacterium]
MNDIVIWGLAGGLAAEFLRWYKLRHSAKLPEYLRSAVYWIMTIGMILIGGVVAWLYGQYGDLSNPLAAAQLGAGTPAMLGALAQGGADNDVAARGGGLNLDENEPHPSKSAMRNFLGFRG